MIEYKIKKLMVSIATGIIPIFVILFLALLGINILIIMFVGMIVGLSVGLIGNIITSNNNWIKAIEKRGMLCFDINSSGIVRVFNVTINVPDITLQTHKGKESRLYDRMISFVLKQPDKDKVGLDEKEDETLKFDMPKKDFQNSLFKSDYLNFLIYNSQTGMFLTKEFLAKREKELMIEYVTLNEWKELKELNKIMRDFTRQTMDTINNSLMDVFARPIFKIIAIILIGIIVLFIGFSFLDIMGINVFDVGSIIPMPDAPTTTTAVSKPITEGASKTITG